MEPLYGHMHITGDLPGGGRPIASVASECFTLSPVYVFPFTGDLDAHAALFAAHLRKCGYSSEVIAQGAVGGVAEMLFVHWSRVECLPFELCRDRMLRWRLAVMQHAIRLAAAAGEAPWAEPCDTVVEAGP